METDFPKGWTGEGGGLSRDHKRIQGEKWENGEGESETKSSGPSRGKRRGKSGRAGRRRRRKGREGGERGGAGRGTPGSGRGAPAGAATRAGCGAPELREAERERLKVPRPCCGPGAACCRREERSGARRPETRNLASRARRGGRAGRKRREGRRPGSELPRRLGEHREWGSGEGRRPGRDGLPGDGEALKALC